MNDEEMKRVINAQGIHIKRHGSEIDNLKRQLTEQIKLNRTQANTISLLKKRMDKIESYFSRRR